MLCSKIGCGGHSAQAAVADRCYCNAECVAYNDCCADYDAICAHGAPAPPPPAPFALSNYRLTATWTLADVEDNLSGVLVLPPKDGPGLISVLVTMNDPPKLRQYKMAAAPPAQGGAAAPLPTFVQEFVLSGFEDTEGVCVGPGGLVLVTEERRKNVVLLPALPDLSGGSSTVIERANATQVYHADIHTHSANKGIEGVAYDPARGLAYAVVEKTPMRVLAFDLDAQVESAEAAAISELFDADAALGPGAGGAGVTDLAGIAYLAPPLDQLAILSQENSQLLRVSRDGALLEAPFALGGTQPEGVAFTPDLATFFVASEPNELLRYDLAPL